VRCSGCGKGVLLGLVGGMKSWERIWSRGGLEGPGETGFEAVVIMEASSTVALLPSSWPWTDEGREGRAEEAHGIS